jgi:inosine-uridine nucleoside N-ribohydrolase
MKHKILLDTDIGSDIDDAVALAYLLCKPQCDLLGITTVSGEPGRRAMMASAQCKLAGREIPIFPGTAEPLLIRSRQPKCP